jgi:hypothetical protein
LGIFFCMCKSMQIKIYRTIILLVLYGCETRSLTLKEGCRRRVFENSVEGNIWA